MFVQNCGKLTFSCCQGIALRSDGKEKDDHFYQLLRLWTLDDLQLADWNEKVNKFTIPEIQMN